MLSEGNTTEGWSHWKDTRRPVEGFNEGIARVTHSAERSANAPSAQLNQAGLLSSTPSPTRRGPRVRLHPARTTLGLTIGVAAAIAVGTMSASLGSGRVAVVTASAASTHVAQPASHAALVASRISKSSAAAAAPISVQPHIMMIVEEYEAESSIIGNTTNAPYLNSLANTYAQASKWYAVQHNSPHDYLDLLVGSDLGLPNGHPYGNTTLVDELHSASIPWKAYEESMPSNCFNGTTSDGLYDSIHNPFHYFKNDFSSSANWWCSSANLSTEGVMPYTSGSSNLVNTLDGINPPDYVYLVPNDCNNMHGSTACSSENLIKVGDSWLNLNLTPVLNSNWFKQDGIVIITWDEGVGSAGCCSLTSPGGQIATIVVAAGNQGQGIYSKAGDHYGTLRAVEEAYGVTPLLGGSANTVNGDLTTAFGSPPGVIAGTVSDTETPAQPVSGATVSYTGAHGSGSTSTNSSGAYTLSGVPAGSYTVSVSETGFTSPASQPVTVTSGSTATANFTMTANSGIGGTLTNSDSSALGTVTVTYTGTNGSTGHGSLNTSTSPYAFTGVPPGTYNVSASEPGFTSPPSQKVTVLANGTATANFVIAAQAQAAIGGTVTGGTNGIQGATVAYTGPNGSGTTQTSDSLGDYQLTAVPDGTYSVTASDTGFEPETFTVTVTGTGTTSQSFVLATGTNGSIAGTVTDAQTAQPISGVVVKASSTSYTATTDASGNYVIENVAPASYSLTFAATNHVTGSAGVTVATSANTEQNAALTETGTISGKVTDASTHLAIVGATVTCASCPVTSVPTDSSGNYSFTQVAPGGGYTVSVTATGYTGQTSGSLTVNPGATTTQNFQLAKPVSVSVHETFGAANTGASGTTTMTAVPGTPTGAGDLLVATIKLRAASGTATVTSVTDSAGNVWTKGPAVGSTNDEEIWYAAGSASVSNTQTNPGVKVTTSAAAAIAFTVLDIAGASVLDQTKTNSATAAPPQPSVGPTNTTTHATEIVIADIGWNSTPTLSGQTTGYALQTVQQSTVTSLKTAEQAAWLILSAPGTPSYGATMSATAAWTAAIATFS